MCNPVEMPAVINPSPIPPVAMPTISAPDCGDRMGVTLCDCSD